MDPIDSGQGQETPSEQGCNLSSNSRGRQRKKNPKYFDYETGDEFHVHSAQQKPSRRCSRGGAASKRSPSKRGKAQKATEEPAGGRAEAADETAEEADGKITKETPKKAARGKKTSTKKTPAKKTPAKKTPAKKTDGALPAVEGGVDAVQQENGKPKRKYVRKRPAREVEAAPEPACKEAHGEPPTEPEEEIQPGGRRRRGAAKAALKYLHILAKEVLGHPSDGDVPEPVSDTKSKGLSGSKGTVETTHLHHHHHHHPFVSVHQ